MDDTEKEQIKAAIAENSKRIDDIIKAENDKRLRELQGNIKRLENEMAARSIMTTLLAPKPTPAYDYSHFNCGAFEKEKSNRCEGCMFLDTYRDMGMSCDICSLERDLDKAAKATESYEPCPNKLTMKEAREYVKQRNSKISH